MEAPESQVSQRMPQLVCFDLDYTLWPLWVDTHVDPPIKRKGAQDVNKVYDRYNSRMSFYDDVPGILVQLKNDTDIHVAIASRTSAPRAAEQALDQLLIPQSRQQQDHKDSPTLIRSIECFDTREIYPGSKIRHFKEIHRKTGIPYEEMVFYDEYGNINDKNSPLIIYCSESRNREVTSLGVTFVLVPEGVNREIFEKGLADWRLARESKHEPVFVERRTRKKT